MTLACIIVTYNPDSRVFLRELHALHAEPLSYVIVVDNGSSSSTLSFLRDETFKDERVQLIEMGSNTGIAAAQNAGIQRALHLGCKWALLLDHDSVPSEGLIPHLLQAAESKVTSGIKLAAIGARTLDPRAGLEHGFAEMRRGIWRKKRCKELDGKLIPCQFLNSSGSLIYIPAWQDIGPFNEIFFIDHVETEWYMRAAAKDYRVFGMCFGQLEHYMGDSVVHYWLFGWHDMPHRSPQRHYTIVRNSLWMYRLPYVSLAWKLNNFVKLFFTLCYFSLFDKDGDKHFRCISRGFCEGLRRLPFTLVND
jgi:rhamnosyltransferase